jgi:hypothetical protein
MLAYDPDSNLDGYFKGWAFDEYTKKLSVEKLTPQLSAQIWDKHQNGITVGDLIRLNCNDSIADEEVFLQAIRGAADAGEVKLKGPNFGSKRSITVSGDDTIIPNRQKLFPNLWPPT